MIRFVFVVARFPGRELEGARNDPMTQPYPAGLVPFLARATPRRSSTFSHLTHDHTHYCSRGARFCIAS